MDDVQNGINAQMHDVQQTISDLNDNVDERSGSSNNIVYRRESKVITYTFYEDDQRQRNMIDEIRISPW